MDEKNHLLSFEFGHFLGYIIFIKRDFHIQPQTEYRLNSIKNN